MIFCVARVTHFTSPCSASYASCQRDTAGPRKFDSGLSLILHHDLYWLDVPQRVIFKLCMTVYKCLHGLAPKYLAELCVPVADVAGRYVLQLLLAEDF